MNLLKSRKTGTILWKSFAMTLGAAMGSFGFYNIHQPTQITEGGLAGLVLLLSYWTDLPQSLFSFPLDMAGYAVAYKHLGKKFIGLSAAAAFLRAVFFRIWEQFPPMLPNLSAHPLVAAVLGALLVSVGTALIICSGGSSSGDDALALTVSHLTHRPIAQVYLVMDISVLLLSLTYIPWNYIGYSLVTVTLSSLLIDRFTREALLKRRKERASEKKSFSAVPRQDPSV